ncbi:outer membrane protein assembly factor BamB [Zoogloea sp.]|uniref:outer membrane protein assembly factor BamB n=1 Tax=Zoogloea sp. TaxID=49181 RepID=UPI001415CB5A|nr:MAG: outer membrane protein assembly factor BamB [Zoogloea sp.]
MTPARLAAAVAGALLLGACSSLNPFASDKNKLPALKPLNDGIRVSEVWKARVGNSGAYVLQPAVSGNAVFAAAADGDVVRLEAGRNTWKASINGALSGGVGSNGQLAVVGTPKGEVVALDAKTGQVKWRVQVNAEILAAPAVSDNLIVVRSADSRLFGLDPQDGRRRWVYQRATPALSLRNSAGVVIEGTAVFAGFPGGKLVAVSAANGSLMWEGTVAVPRGATELERMADITSLPVLGARSACAVAFQGRIACFDLANGSTLWARDLSSSRGLDMDSRYAYVTDEKGAVHALDLNTGASAWKQDQLAGRNVGRPRVSGGYVVVGDGEGYVHLLRKDDGGMAGRQRVDSSPILADIQRSDGEMVIQSKDGNVYGLGLQ